MRSGSLFEIQSKTFIQMPPRKLPPRPNPEPAARPPSTRQSDIKPGKPPEKTAPGKAPVQAPPEPEIDIAAVLQEYIAESNARIADALQARHDELVEKLINLDNSLATAGVRKKP
jgi:hypothetical protein